MGPLRLAALIVGLALSEPAAWAEDAPPFGQAPVIRVRSAQDAASLRAAIVRDIWTPDAVGAFDRG